MKIRNDDMVSMSEACERNLDDCGILGYACARNLRILTMASLEYSNIRDKLVRHYGSPDYDENGNETGYTITPQSENWDALVKELSEFASIEHEVDLYKVDAEKLVGAASGRTLIELSWMLDWGDGNEHTDDRA